MLFGESGNKSNFFMTGDLESAIPQICHITQGMCMPDLGGETGSKEEESHC